MLYFSNTAAASFQSYLLPLLHSNHMYYSYSLFQSYFLPLLIPHHNYKRHAPPLRWQHHILLIVDHCGYSRYGKSWLLTTPFHGWPCCSPPHHATRLSNGSLPFLLLGESAANTVFLQENVQHCCCLIPHHVYRRHTPPLLRRQLILPIVDHCDFTTVTLQGTEKLPAGPPPHTLPRLAML